MHVPGQEFSELLSELLSGELLSDGEDSDGDDSDGDDSDGDDSDGDDSDGDDSDDDDSDDDDSDDDDSDGELDSDDELLLPGVPSIHQRIPRRVGTGHTLTGEPSGRYSVLSSAFQIRATTY